MADIQITKTHAEPGETSLAVSVPPESVRAAEERATRAYQQRARLPGFRQGKAPAAVVRKKFAEDIRQQALQELVQESWRAAVEQEKLKPIADPHIHNLKWEEGAPVTFIVGSAEALPFADSSFDGATASMTVHHWRDAERGLAELARVLRPGGRAAIADIDLPGSLRSVLRLVRNPHAGWSRRDRKSTRLNSSHPVLSRMPSSA